MKVVIYGANGSMGPHVIKVLEREHELRLSDINELEGSSHEYRKVDASDLEQVVDAAKGMDAIVNLSVLRGDRRLAFDVSARGCYNVMTAAVTHGIDRVINTGPHFTVAGLTYERFDYNINPDIPPQPGTNIYALTKSLGLEISRVFTEVHDIYVMMLLYYHFADRRFDTSSHGKDPSYYAVTWSDCGESIRSALSVDFESLPSRCEVFFISADIPHQKFSNEKAKRILGWQPTDKLSRYWSKAGK